MARGLLRITATQKLTPAKRRVMIRLISFALFSFLAWPAFGQGTTAPPSPDKMFDAIRPGYWVRLIPQGTSIMAEVSADRPPPARVTDQVLAVRSAELQAKLAQEEYQAALAANQQSANVVSPRDMVRLRYGVEQSQLRLQQLRNTYDAEPYQVFAVGSEYVGFQRGNEQRLIAASQIKAILRTVSPAAPGTPRKPEPPR
jgi:hypothetical protein